MSERPEKKKIDIDKVVSYLSRMFAQAMQEAGRNIGFKNTKGTTLYDYQVEFCYLIYEITQGPRYIAPKRITEANELIQELANLGGEIPD